MQQFEIAQVNGFNNNFVRRSKENSLQCATKVHSYKVHSTTKRVEAANTNLPPRRLCAVYNPTYIAPIKCVRVKSVEAANIDLAFKSPTPSALRFLIFHSEYSNRLQKKHTVTIASVKFPWSKQGCLKFRISMAEEASTAPTSTKLYATLNKNVLVIRVFEEVE